MLQITSEPLAPRQVQLTIVVPPEREAREIDAVAQAFAKRQRIPGYRPGKVPHQRIAELVGEENLREAVNERLVNQVALEAVRTEKLQPVAPVAAEVLSEHPLTVRVVVPLQPMVNLGDYLALRVPVPEVAAVEDADIDAAIDELRGAMAELQTVDRAAEAGDLIELALVGRLVEPDDAAGEVVFEDPALKLRLSSEAAAEAGVSPAVVDELVGHGAGQHAEFRVTYSELWPEARLQGRALAFRADIAAVQSEVQPSPEVAAERLGAPSLAALRENIGAQMKLRAILDARAALLDQAIRTLVEQAEVEYPPALFEAELAETVAALRESVERQGFPWERWLALQQDEDRDTLVADLERMTEARLRQTWVLLAFADAEQLRLSQAQVDAEVNRVIAQQAKEPGGTPGRKRPDRDAVRDEVAAGLISRMATARLIEIVTGGADFGADEIEAMFNDADVAGDGSGTAVDQPIEDPTEG